jgi:hypothetical protein
MFQIERHRAVGGVLVLDHTHGRPIERHIPRLEGGSRSLRLEGTSGNFSSIVKQ